MAVIQSGATTDLLTVDPTNKAARMAWYAQEGRIYTAKATTGVLAATLAVDAVLFGMREAAAPTKNIYIMRIDMGFSVNVAFTATQQFGIYIQRFSTANMTGGAAVTPMKYNTSDAATEAQDIRVATTAALGSAGVVFDGATGVVLLGWTNKNIDAQVGPFTVFDHTESGPIKLQAGEGLCFRNLIVWPAAGTGVLTSKVSWIER